MADKDPTFALPLSQLLVASPVQGTGTTAVQPSTIVGYPSDLTKFLAGDGSWKVPISVYGPSSVATAQNTTNGAYVDLATVGPTITGLPDGVYLIFHGAALVTGTADQQAFQSVSFNGAGPSDADA